jgi:membrane-associated phospholipid phosphatase
VSWTKIVRAIALPVWADPLRARAAQALCGIDPWQAAQAAFGWAAPLIDEAYVTWAPVKFATLLVVVSLPETPQKTRALTSYFVLMASVALGQYLFSSAGPVFYAQLGLGDRFADLKLQPWVVSARAYLWQDYLRGSRKIGAGISAMPSMHVAISLWIALVLRSFRRSLAVVGFAYFAIISVGSVLLGWHYAIDGLAGIAIALLAWRAAALPFRRSEKFEHFKLLRSTS